jgi:uncharacterized membrane-anchored protein YjiN (DUF445 family)
MFWVRLEASTVNAGAVRPASLPRRNHVGTVSLLVAVAGAAGSRAVIASRRFGDATWLHVVAAGFEAAMVGGLADWFAVTALFRHPLGIPIPHTAIIPARRDKIIDGIVTMVEEDWLSPEAILERLHDIVPSDEIVKLLRDPRNVERIGGPVRDLVRAFGRILTAEEVVGFVERALARELRGIRVDVETGRWLARAASSDSAGAAFTTLASSLANLAARPRTADELHWWLERAASELRARGQRLLPFALRRKSVQRLVVKSVCDYAATEFANAASDPSHPLRRLVLGSVERFAERLGAGEETALAQSERLWTALVESLDAGPVVRDTLQGLRAQLEHDLDDPAGALATLIDRELHGGILALLADPHRRARFDRFVRETAEDLVRRKHHEIGNTVREVLQKLKTDELVSQIEARVGADLQYIRLNGAVVGGLVGVAIAVAHWLAG